MSGGRKRVAAQGTQQVCFQERGHVSGCHPLHLLQVLHLAEGPELLSPGQDALGSLVPDAAQGLQLFGIALVEPRQQVLPALGSLTLSSPSLPLSLYFLPMCCPKAPLLQILRNLNCLCYSKPAPNSPSMNWKHTCCPSGIAVHLEWAPCT